LAHVLFREREALRLEPLRRVCEVPRREVGDTEPLARERDELPVFALGKGLRAPREPAQESEDFVDAPRHLRDERNFGVIG
jgi:hypothetical protein